MPVARTEDEIGIAYESSGEGPPDLLFLHGFAGSGAFLTVTVAEKSMYTGVMSPSARATSTFVIEVSG